MTASRPSSGKASVPLDELLAEAEPFTPDLTELWAQFTLTALVTMALAIIGLGVDCLLLTTTHVHSGDFFITLGTAALLFITGEHTIRQHRSGVSIAPAGFTDQERATFIIVLLLAVAAVAF